MKTDVRVEWADTRLAPVAEDGEKPGAVLEGLSAIVLRAAQQVSRVSRVERHALKLQRRQTLIEGSNRPWDRPKPHLAIGEIRARQPTATALIGRVNERAIEPKDT